MAQAIEDKRRKAGGGAWVQQYGVQYKGSGVLQIQPKYEAINAHNSEVRNMAIERTIRQFDAWWVKNVSGKHPRKRRVRGLSVEPEYKVDWVPTTPAFQLLKDRSDYQEKKAQYVATVLRQLVGAAKNLQWLRPVRPARMTED